MAEKNVLRLENVTMQFGGVVAVNDLSLEVNKGEIVALIGPNGAGKTTVFNLLTKVYQPTTGTVLIDGKDMSAASQKIKDKFRIEKIGYIFQDFKLINDMTVADNIGILRLEGVDISGMDDMLRALDIYEKRLNAVQESAKRLGIFIITTHAEDASKFTAIEKADKILVDAPCSGLGVIRRRPDLKYKEELTEFDGLIKTQSAILENCAQYLKPAGQLVYSTCTINPAENEGVVTGFLKKHPEFSLMPITSEHITGEAAELLQKGMATFYPSLQGGDGFFIAKLRRESI